MNNDASNIMKSRYAKKAARVKTKEIRRKYRQEVHGRYYYLIKGFLISILISVPLFFILALAMRITDFSPEEYMPPALLTTVLASIVVASFYATAAAKANGWFNGTLTVFSTC